MTEWIAGRRSARPVSPVLAIALFAVAIGLTMLTVVADIRPEVFVALAACIVALGVLALCYERLLTWPKIVAVTAVVVLVIPIRREAIAGNLPFALEPYRVLVALVIALWIAALLVDPRVRLRRTFLDAPLLAILGVSFASVAVNQSRVRGLGVESIVTKSVVFLLGFFLFYWLIVSVVRRFVDVDLIVRILVTTGAVIAVFGLIEARTGYSIFNKIVQVIPGSDRSVPLDPSINDPVRGGRLASSGRRSTQLSSPPSWRCSSRSPCTSARQSRRWRWWLAMALVLLGSLATVSRTGLVMLLVIVVVFLWLRPRETRRLWPLAIPGVVVVHVVAPGAMRGSSPASSLPEG